MKNLQDLFQHEISDLYSAEKQLTEAFPRIIAKATDAKLSNLLNTYKTETENQFEEIQAICENLSYNPRNTKCQAMKGLIKEAESLMRHDAEDEVLDAAIIARVQRIMHYEISAYGTAVRFAKEIGNNSISEKLQTILDAKYNVDEQLGKLAKRRINEEALA